MRDVRRGTWDLGRRALLLAPCTLPLAPSLASAQRDTSRIAPLDAIVVTAERAASTVSSSAASVTRLTRDELARLPHATLADLLRRAPGFSLVDFDGLGFDPQLMVRGFYGGGEAEYVIVLVDGRPASQLQTGVVAWDALPPLPSIESVEIMRGGASALYGDAAIGGVINVITRTPAAGAPARWQLGGGAYGTWRGSLAWTGAVGARGVTLGAGADLTDGYRSHASRATERITASVSLVESGATRVSLNASAHARDFDEPGPLTQSRYDEDRRSSDPLFRFDNTADRDYLIGVGGERRVGDNARLSGTLHGEYRTIDAVRTIALAPGFGDTKERETESKRGIGTIQLDIDDALLAGRDRLTFGADVSRGDLDSKYYRILTGDRDQYAASNGERDGLDATGSMTRDALATFVQYAVQATPALRLTLGGRFDWLEDDFSDDTPGAPSRATASHAAFSPKAGLNVRYMSGARATGNAYVTAGRSFKAPTPDQLFDLRSIPVPFPPFAIRTSNATLVPQYGTNVEAGLYHGIAVSANARATVSLSVYQMDMKDELDFDVTELRYVNIGRSRHRGAEAGLSLANGRGMAAFLNYALQSPTARSGENAGRNLKAIPRHTLGGGLSFAPLSRLETGVTATHVRDMYIDDANTRAIPDYTRIDLRAAYTVLGVTIVADVRNAFDAKYSTTGFLDPSGSGEAYFYPAAGRVIEIGVRKGW